jgi:hypothetical protein
MPKKLSLEEVLNDSPNVVQADLEKEIEKKPKRQKGGNNERNSLLRALIQSNELTLRYLREINQKIDSLHQQQAGLSTSTRLQERRSP